MCDYNEMAENHRGYPRPLLCKCGAFPSRYYLSDGYLINCDDCNVGVSGDNYIDTVNRWNTRHKKAANPLPV